LVARQGGFNLSNAKPLDFFVEQYDRSQIQKAVRSFTPNDLVQFLCEIGVETYVGTSGKIFPQKGIKPIQVLQAWLKKLQEYEHCIFHYSHKLINFCENKLIFSTSEGKTEIALTNEKVIFACGGASYQITGSDGKWATLFQQKGIETIPFQVSNSGMEITSKLLEKFQGSYLKNCRFQLGEKSILGEIVITKYGFEGSPIYYLNREFRNGNHELFIDFKPNFSIEKIMGIIQQAKNTTTGLKKLKLPEFVIEYLHESLRKEEFLATEKVAKTIKNASFTVHSLRPIDESISTVGGVSMEAIQTDFSLKKFPNFYCIGEMLDWDAPTGGYLLQACFSIGKSVGENG